MIHAQGRRVSSFHCHLLRRSRHHRDDHRGIELETELAQRVGVYGILVAMSTPSEHIQELVIT